MCVVLRDIWGKRNDRVFRGKERDLSEVWSMCLFGVRLQRPSVIIRLAIFYLVGTPPFGCVVLVGS